MYLINMGGQLQMILITVKRWHYLQIHKGKI